MFQCYGIDLHIYTQRRRMLNKGQKKPAEIERAEETIAAISFLLHWTVFELILGSCISGRIHSTHSTT